MSQTEEKTEEGTSSGGKVTSINAPEVDTSTIHGDGPGAMIVVPPSTDKIQMQYYPYSENNGWYLHNQYRETLINKKLHECKALSEAPMKVCEQGGGVAPHQEFWETNRFAAAAGVIAIMLGYYIGSRGELKYSRRDEHTSRLLRLDF